MEFCVDSPLGPRDTIGRFVATKQVRCSPWRRGLSAGVRELGFALFTAFFADEHSMPWLK